MPRVAASDPVEVTGTTVMRGAVAACQTGTTPVNDGGGIEGGGGTATISMTAIVSIAATCADVEGVGAEAGVTARGEVHLRNGIVSLGERSGGSAAEFVSSRERNVGGKGKGDTQKKGRRGVKARSMMQTRPSSGKDESEMTRASIAELGERGGSVMKTAAVAIMTLMVIMKVTITANVAVTAGIDREGNTAIVIVIVIVTVIVMRMKNAGISEGTTLMIVLTHQKSTMREAATMARIMAVAALIVIAEILTVMRWGKIVRSPGRNAVPMMAQTQGKDPAVSSAQVQMEFTDRTLEANCAMKRSEEIFTTEAVVKTKQDWDVTFHGTHAEKV